MYHLEEQSISTAIQYKKCAQILVSSVNKIPIQYAFGNTTESYTVKCEHGIKYAKKLSEYHAEQASLKTTITN